MSLDLDQAVVFQLFERPPGHFTRSPDERGEFALREIAREMDAIGFALNLGPRLFEQEIADARGHVLEGEIGREGREIAQAHADDRKNGGKEGRGIPNEIVRRSEWDEVDADSTAGAGRDRVGAIVEEGDEIQRLAGIQDSDELFLFAAGAQELDLSGLEEIQTGAGRAFVENGYAIRIVAFFDGARDEFQVRRGQLSQKWDGAQVIAGRSSHHSTKPYESGSQYSLGVTKILAKKSH